MVVTVMVVITALADHVVALPLTRLDHLLLRRHYRCRGVAYKKIVLADKNVWIINVRTLLLLVVIMIVKLGRVILRVQRTVILTTVILNSVVR